MVNWTELTVVGLVAIAWLTAAAPMGAQQTGETFRDRNADGSGCAVCPEMVVVPTGSFTMGSPDTEEGRDEDEGPQHLVTIHRPFAVGKYEVTFAEWDACVAAGGCDGYRPDDQGRGRGNRPVASVHWVDARNYVAWLSGTTNQLYRLLTEAEWEYAARAGTTTRYSWGDDIGSGNANCDGCSSEWDGRQTAPVGSFSPNGFGLHDMHGNVWEWVEDNRHGNYIGAPTDGSAWTTGGRVKERVLRGGAWDYEPHNLHSAARTRSGKRNRDPSDGFRIARSL